MYLYEFLLYYLRVFGRSYEEQLPAQLTAEELFELFPIENNLAIRDLSQMHEKPENFWII